MKIEVDTYFYMNKFIARNILLLKTRKRNRTHILVLKVRNKNRTNILVQKIGTKIEVRMWL